MSAGPKPPRKMQRAADRLAARMRGKVIRECDEPGAYVLAVGQPMFYATPVGLRMLGAHADDIAAAQARRPGQVPVILLLGPWCQLRWFGVTALSQGGAA